LRPIPGSLLSSISALALSGCLYGFAGGGLPPGIRTVAVLPFDNLTAEPTLTQEVQQAVRTAVQGRLGLRESGETSADAIVRGVITRYDPDLPVAYQGTQNNQVDVTKRLVQITVSVEIMNQHTGKPLWQRSSLSLQGDYDPGQEPAGRQKAYDLLVTNIVEGAQSQW
jgi:lipopolysaccharide assembly LptE-like protein